MTTTVNLPPALERFAQECVDEGRYESVSAVVSSALQLLQEAEEERRQFQASLDEAMEEARREGTYSVEEVLAEARAIIDDIER
jgi:antitoxin ParD1/3/4